MIIIVISDLLEKNGLPVSSVITLVLSPVLTLV